MSNAMSFATWFLDNIPDFLLSEPICYFVGIILMSFLIKMILSICGLSERRYK